MRFVMSRFVSSSQERGMVNYEELVKFLARCLGDRGQFGAYPGQMAGSGGYNQPYGQPYGTMMNSPRANQNADGYDPDEQAILRQMHENMRDWDQVNLINCDQLRKKFYEVDPYNRYILTQREVIYKQILTLFIWNSIYNEFLFIQDWGRDL